MTISTNAKRIVRIMKGDTQVWEDTDTWVQLRLGVGVTGNVLFKDNGDGTASLCGEISGPLSMSSLTLLAYPPKGYSFKATHWNSPKAILADNTEANPMMVNVAYDDNTIKVANGNLYYQNTSGINSSYKYVCVISFTYGRMYSGVKVKNVADPVPIDIAPA